MKKWLALLLAVVLSGVIFAAGCGDEEAEPDPDADPSDDPEETFELLIATFEARETGYMTDGIIQFAEDLEDRSDGRVETEISFGGEMGEIPEHYDLVHQGVVDMAFAPTFMVPGVFPLADITTLPWRFESSQHSTEVMQRMYQQGYLDEAYDEGVKPIFVSAAESDELYHINKPVHRPEDIEGERIIARSWGNIQSVERMGASSAMFAGPEVYEALDRGTVEGQIVGRAAAPTWGWCEVMEYQTPKFQGTAKWAFFINENTYNDLPEDIQEIIDDMASDNTYGDIGARNLDQMAEEAQECLDEHGVEKVDWEQETWDELDELFAPIWEEWIQEREEMGLPAEEAVDAMYEIMQETGAEDPAIGYTP